MVPEDSKVEKAVEKAFYYYLDNLELRQAISNIPGIGTALDYMFSSLGQGFQQRRLFETIQCMHEEMIQISESKIDTPFLHTEEFYDFAMKTFDNCSKTRHNDKIRFYCKILVGAVIIDNSTHRHSVEDFLSFLSELSPTDLQVGLEIFKLQKDMPEHFDFEIQENTELGFAVQNGWSDIRNNLQIDEVDFKIALYKLSRAGLIKEIVGTYVSYTGGHYLITPAFKKLMDFIKYSKEPIFNYKIRQQSEK
jgi:hypothetical protein